MYYLEHLEADYVACYYKNIFFCISIDSTMTASTIFVYDLHVTAKHVNISFLCSHNIDDFICTQNKKKTRILFSVGAKKYWYESYELCYNY